MYYYNKSFDLYRVYNYSLIKISVSFPGGAGSLLPLEMDACLPGCVCNATPRSLSPLEWNIGFWTHHFHFPLSCIGEGNGNPLQYSCLENPRERGAYWAAIYGVEQRWTRLKWLSSLAAKARSHVQEARLREAVIFREGIQPAQVIPSRRKLGQ